MTWLIPPSTIDSAYHVRIHKLTNLSSRKILAADSGFAIHSHSGPVNSERRLLNIDTVSEGISGRFQSKHAALIVSKAGASGVIDLIGSVAGAARVQDADGNSNLISPRTAFPLILSECEQGETTWLATKIYAVPFGDQGLETRGWKFVWEEEAGGAGLEILKLRYPFIG